jgi:hypothetical protein
VMRDKIGSRRLSEDEDLTIAEARFGTEYSSWIMPDAEDEYQEGIEHLGKYLERLSKVEDPEAKYDASAENLDYWLGTVEVRLSSLTQRLSASVDQKRINNDLASKKPADKTPKAVKGIEKSVDKTVAIAAESEEATYAKTPWLEIDDVFYEARGTSWALIHLLRAVEIDFADVLKDKNAQVNIAQIIRELEATQQQLGSPMVLNGSGFGLWANHSLVMASYISRANAAIMDLRVLLKQG